MDVLSGACVLKFLNSKAFCASLKCLSEKTDNSFANVSMNDECVEMKTAIINKSLRAFKI